MVFKFIIMRHDDPPSAAPFAEHIFREEIVTIGSDASATLRLAGANVAPEQALIIVEAAASPPLLINRAPGTTLNGETLAREIRRPLADGDHLGIGDWRIIFDLSDPSNANGSRLTSKGDAAGHTVELTNDLPPVAPPPAPAAVAKRAGEPKSFASILNELRTEEDSFCFEIETGAQAGTRLVIDAAETIVGWDAAGERVVVADAVGESAVERMIVRKDWTGVVVEARGGAGALRVNDAGVNDPRRLRDGDRVTIGPASEDSAAGGATLVFREPASLVVLDSLLPQKLPPPVVNSPASAAPAAVAPADHAPAAPPEVAERRSPMVVLRKKYLSYFSRTELLVMALGTVIAAVIIFLVLEYS